MTISENVKRILDEIDGRAVLVAATKMNDVCRVREAIGAGIQFCGENRVQELVEKNAQNAYDGAHLHFIGHLQKNKVSKVVGTCELIQSIDTSELLSAVAKEAQKKGITQDVLLEINIGAEESKSGFSPADVYNALEAVPEGVYVKGLMCIPPICRNSNDNRPFFDQMAELFVDIDSKKYDNVSMGFLSMGMSNDYLTAIECGSNMVRVGTGIFGPRNY